MGYPKILAALILGIGLIFSVSAYGETLKSRMEGRTVVFNFSCDTESTVRALISVDDELGLQTAWNFFNSNIQSGECQIHNGKVFVLKNLIGEYAYANSSLGERGTSYFVKLQDLDSGMVVYSVVGAESVDRLFPPLPEA